MNEEPKDVRLPLMVSRSTAEAIDAWRYASHIPTRAEAIRRLIELGLQLAEDGKRPEPDNKYAKRTATKQRLKGKSRKPGDHGED